MKTFYIFIMTTLLLMVGEGVWGQTQTFSYTGSEQTFTVPAGVTSIDVKLWGAGGGGERNFASGGSGAFLKGTLAVTPGESYVIIVGQGGSKSDGGLGTTSSSYGGGGKGTGYGAAGGGYSGVFINSISIANAKAIAGGGGGGATGGLSKFGTGGGNASTDNNLQGDNGNGGGGGGYEGGEPSKGGSSYYTPLGATTHTVGTTNNNGAGAQAPNNGQSGYVPGVGQGGKSNNNGGNGLVIIEWVPAPTGPDLSIEDITASSEICEGASEEVTVSIKNTGDALATSTDYKLQYRFNSTGTWTGTTNVDNVGSNDTEDFQINVTAPNTAGDSTLNIRLINTESGTDVLDADGKNITIKDCDPEPTITDVTFNPTSFCEGEEGGITVEIKNIGSDLGPSSAYTLEYQYNGGAWVTIPSAISNLNTNATISPSFVLTETTAGVYDINFRILDTGVLFGLVHNETLTVVDCTLPDFSIVSVESGATLCADEEEVITVNIKNEGGGVGQASTDYTLEYRVNSGTWTNGGIVADIGTGQTVGYNFVFSVPTGVDAYVLNIRVTGPGTEALAATFVNFTTLDCSVCMEQMIVVSGSGTFVVPPNVTSMTIEAWGGGGGGGGTSGSNSSGGGGGGAYASSTINNPSGTYTYSVGAGGAGGTSGSQQGASGGDSFFSQGSNIVVAAGGKGGSQGSGAGGQGGTASSSTGDIKFSGRKGYQGRGSSTGGGGGGGGAGTTDAGVDAPSDGNGGAGGPGNPNGKGGNGVKNSDSPNSGVGYGGGGGGNSGTRSGGNGANGAIRITFVCDVIPVIIDAVTTDPSPLCLDQEGEVTVNLTNNSGSPITGINYKLQYSLSPSGPWSDIATNITSVPTLGASYAFNFTPTTTGNTIIYYRLMDGSTLVNTKVSGINTINCNPPADSNCENATLIETNSTYIGNTGDFPIVGSGHWLNGGGNTIENIGYYKFVASETSISFNACTGCGSFLGGIQFFIFTKCGVNSSLIATLRQLSSNSGTITTTGNLSNSGNSNGCSTFTLSGLTIGQTYYWGVDGFEGDNCPYTINFLSGIDILPIELTSFTGRALSQGNLLEWETASETDNDFFTLSRSTDGFAWEEIAEIKGAGSSQTTLNYEFLDRKAGPGVSYYKLRQTDYDGVNKTFDVISVLRSIKEDVIVHPNPSNGSFKVSFYSQTQEEVSMVIYDNLGKECYSNSFTLDKGVNSIPVALNGVRNGVYYLRTVIGEEVMTQKIVVNY